MIQNKNAGLKTNMMVAIGAAVFASLALHFKDEEFVDVTRVLGQIVTGIGYIGTGVILHQGTTVRGLNTAATGVVRRQDVWLQLVSTRSPPFSRINRFGECTFSSY